MDAIKIFLVTLCTMPFGVQAQCAPDSNPEEIKLAILDVCGDDANCIKSRVEKLTESEHCFCQQIGALLDLYSGYGLLDHQGATPFECNPPYYTYAYWLGIDAYKRGHYEKAIDSFWRVLEAKQLTSSCLTNIGSAYFQMGHLDYAFPCFVDAWEEEALKPSEAFMVLNNMAGILIQTGQWREALPWIAKAKQIIADQDPQYNPNQLTLGSEISAQVEANEWIAHLNLNDSEFIAANWRAIQWGNIHLPAWNWMYMILKTAEILNQQEFYASQTRLLRQMALELSTDPVIPAELGIYNALIRAAIDDDLSLQQLTEVWLWSTETTLNTNAGHSDAAKSTSELNRAMRQLLPWAGWITLAIVLGATWLLKRKRTQKKLVKIKSATEALEIIRAWHSGRGADFEQVTNSIAFVQRRMQDSIRGWLSLNKIDLSEAEFKVLQLTLASKAPKEIALSEEWTPSYVYKIRSQLREQLNVPKDEELDSWILSNLKL